MSRFDRIFNNDEMLDRRRIDSSPADVRGLPPGEWICNGVYRMVYRHPLGYPHGNRPLSSPDEVDVMRSFGATERTVFLDLETTGLAGGSGTYAFLCALGSVDACDFAVEQFFLKGPSKERAWIEAIDRAIPHDASIITYNGASFDMPMLASRSVMCRYDPQWASLPHIDLLRLTRKFYRGRLNSCSLGSIERHVLGSQRTDDDIPGSMIPSIYMEYLDTHDATKLSGVFYHNAIDIVSLAALYIHIGDLLEGCTSNGFDLLRASEIWRSIGASEKSDELLCRACEMEHSAISARIRRAIMSKRMLRWIDSRNDLLSALEMLNDGRGKNTEALSLFIVCEELAKIEEHHLSAPQEAMRYVDIACDWLKKNRCFLGPRYRDLIMSITKRRDRLKKKILKIER